MSRDVNVGRHCDDAKKLLDLLERTLFVSEGRDRRTNRSTTIPARWRITDNGLKERKAKAKEKEKEKEKKRKKKGERREERTRSERAFRDWRINSTGTRV